MTSTTPSILLVESSQASIDIFLRLFENDFEVSITNTGKACLAFIAETSPDVLIISDQLDDISSLQVCNKIRESGEIKSLFIHLITENNNPENLLAAYKAGYDEFIVKPQNFDEGHWLPPRIGKLLRRDNSHLARHNSSYQEDTPIEIRQSIGEASLDVLCSHNLIATLMIYGNHEPVFMSSYGETYDLDK
ncbi:MAG: response regulator, partial [Gammaproteobacteria bacterium]|nr:response regulator [Gammaproteobacteria bacterium]